MVDKTKSKKQNKKSKVFLLITILLQSWLFDDLEEVINE